MLEGALQTDEESYAKAVIPPAATWQRIRRGVRGAWLQSFNHTDVHHIILYKNEKLKQQKQNPKCLTIKNWLNKLWYTQSKQ